MGILIPLVLILFTCLIIWRACDGFEVASRYVGRHLSEGVRGGTINAISSSLPELFTTLIALFVFDEREAFSVGLGTTAGSAIFNGMIIPAFCIFFVVGTVVMGQKVKRVEVSMKVILRDGVALILGQILLLVMLMGTKLYWWQGFILMAFYALYLFYMIRSMKAGKRQSGEKDDEEDDEGEEAEGGKVARLFYWLSLGPLLDLESMFVKKRQREQMKAETWNGWPLLLASAVVIGLACYILVKACEWLGTGPQNEFHSSYTLFGNEFEGLGMPAIFVAVIFASMATSVPDTIISIRDAQEGDYDDAVSNALGSNMFDICFALGFPLFLFTLLYGPIEMSADTIADSGELRVMLLVLTLISLAIYLIGWRGHGENRGRLIGLGRTHAALLLSLYAIFVAYVIGKRESWEWALAVGDWAQGVSAWLYEVCKVLPFVK